MHNRYKAIAKKYDKTHTKPYNFWEKIGCIFLRKKKGVSIIKSQKVFTQPK